MLVIYVYTFILNMSVKCSQKMGMFFSMKISNLTVQHSVCVTMEIKFLWLGLDLQNVVKVREILWTGLTETNMPCCKTNKN